MKKILILGASFLQLPAIMTAKEMGIYVGVADYNVDAVGIPYADEYFNVSTIDEQGVYQAAKSFGANGIMAFATDMPMRAVAYACQRLGLEGITPETARMSTDKYEMLKAFQRSGVSCPSYFLLHHMADLEKVRREQITYPCIMKPIDNSGSRGVILVQNENELESAFLYSNHYTRNHSGVLLEEYLEGPEVSVEVLVCNGEIHILAITDKQTTGSPHYVETGHSQPSILKSKDREEIADLTRQAVAAVGIHTGPAHVEMKMTQRGPVMIELGARLGGDFITSHLVKLSTGIDMVGATIRLLMKETPDLTNKEAKASAVKHITGDTGKIYEIKGVNKARKIEGIKDIIVRKHIGDTIGRIMSSADFTCSVVAQAGTASEAVHLCEEAAACIQIITI